MLAARMFGITPNFSPSVWLTIGSEISSWGKVQKYLCRAMGSTQPWKGPSTARALLRARTDGSEGRERASQQKQGRPRKLPPKRLPQAGADVERARRFVAGRVAQPV